MRFKDITKSSQKCPHCGGPLVEYSGLMEKKDACYYKVKASAKVWPSAYASGRLVQCRKKGAANYGNKSESVAEGIAQDEAEEEYGGWRAEFVDEINYNTFEIRVTNARSKESANFIVRPVDMVSYGPTLSIETMDVRDLQTGQTESWTNDDPAPKGPIAYAISALFYDDKQLQKKLNNIIDTHNTKGQDMIPGLEKRRSIGQEVDSDSYIDSSEKTQAAMAKMKQGMAEGVKPEILFYAKIPDGSRVYARVKDEEQIARLQQQYRGAEIKTFDYNRPDILAWLEARGINLRKFTPGMVQTMYPGSRGHPGSTGLNEFAPGGSGDGGNDGFSDDTLRQLAAQWYNGDEDPKVEQTLMAAGWEIGQDEGYDDEPGVFVVQAGDINGNSYMSWSAEELKGLEESALSDLPRPGKRNQFRSLHKIRKQRGLDEQGVAEDAVDDFLAKGGKIETGKTHKPRKVERWQGSSHIGAAGGRGSKGTVSGQAANTNPKSNKPVVSAESLGNIKMNEKYNPEYDDEAGMADNNLQTLARAVEGIDDLIQTGDNLPEWCQEKIAVAKSMLVAVWDYMYSEEASDEVDPEIDAMFEAMDQLVHETAHAQQLSVDLVWESFESLPDHMLYETAAWRRKEGKSKKGGLNAKGVASYRRENPGSKLQMAVTTKPSKLKPGSKAAKRRKSFCARMSGVKGPMKKPNGKPTRKALALRKWNC